MAVMRLSDATRSLEECEQSWSKILLSRFWEFGESKSSRIRLCRRLDSLIKGCSWANGIILKVQGWKEMIEPFLDELSLQEKSLAST